MKHLTRSLLAAVVACAAVTAPARALEITYVQHQPAAFDPRKKEHVTLRFRLSESARVEANFFDVRDVRIRTIAPAKSFAAGDHEIRWDGRDQRGEPVPPEAYLYTLVATSESRERVEWDVTDYTGGEPVRAQAVKWDAKAGKLSYFLPRASRVNVRLGLADDGPLMRTLLDWVPRTIGQQMEPWDGKDQSGSLDLSQHPGLMPSVTAFALSDNTVFVLPAPREIGLGDSIPEPRIERAKKKEVPKRNFAYGQQRFAERKDFPLQLTLAEKHPVDDEGMPVMDSSSSIAVRIDLPPREQSRAANERFEVLFFVDGQMVFENEIGFLPMTWTWNLQGINEGVHYVTANLRGYDGHYGVATLRFRVRKSSAPSSVRKP